MLTTILISVAILIGVLIILIFTTGKGDRNKNETIYAEFVSPVEYKIFKNVGVYDRQENPGYNGQPQYDLANRSFHGSTRWM